MTTSNYRRGVRTLSKHSATIAIRVGLSSYPRELRRDIWLTLLIATDANRIVRLGKDLRRRLSSFSLNNIAIMSFNVP